MTPELPWVETVVDFYDMEDDIALLVVTMTVWHAWIVCSSTPFAVLADFS